MWSVKRERQKMLKQVKNEQNLSNLWNNMKWTERIEKEMTLEEIVADNFPMSWRKIILQIQEISKPKE